MDRSGPTMRCNDCRKRVDDCDCSSFDSSTPEYTSDSCESPKLSKILKKELDDPCSMANIDDPCSKSSLESAMTAIAALPVRDNPCCYKEDTYEKCTASISSKSENSSFTTPKGVIFARGRGLPSLLIGYLMVSAVAISRSHLCTGQRPAQPVNWLSYGVSCCHFEKLEVAPVVALYFGLPGRFSRGSLVQRCLCPVVFWITLGIFYSLLTENSCYNTDSEIVYNLKKRLDRAHHELRYREKRIQQTERKLTSVLSIAKTLIEHGFFDNGDDQFKDLPTLNRRCSGRR